VVVVGWFRQRKFRKIKWKKKRKKKRERRRECHIRFQNIHLMQ